MSSGSLPLATYHRTQALGDGSFGSVLTVYNDDGEEFAMKLFLADEDEEESDETLEVGALVEISMLRILREENGHPNIVSMVDVRGAAGEMEEEDDDCGAGTAGVLAMAMPLYPSGSLEQALEHSSALVQSRRSKIRIAHGLLSAVAFLHDNGILHRDIKADNVMLRTNDDNTVDAVLIDFSIAKFVNATVYGDPDNCWLRQDTKEPATHTGQCGTATYMSPECNASEPYGLSSDMWSVGVVLLELLQKQPFQAVKATQAETLVAEALEKLPADKPFPTLVRNLLRKNPNERWTARQALENMSTALFADMEVPVPPVKIIDMKRALPVDDDNDQGEENVAPKPTTTKTPGKNKKNKKKVDSVIDKRWKLVEKLGRELDAVHPLTLQATMSYAVFMMELDDELDNISESQTLLDCLVLAYKMFEPCALDLADLEESEDYKSFANWSLEDYRDNEATILLMMDHCLYPRELLDL